MKPFKYIALTAVLGWLFFLVSEDDYQMELADNIYWCQQIDAGIWFASIDEYEARCND